MKKTLIACGIGEGMRIGVVGARAADGRGGGIDAALARPRRGQCRITGGAADVKVLGLPRERGRRMRRKPDIIFFQRDARRAKIGDRIAAYMLRIARHHDRSLDRTAMDAMAQFFR